MTIDQATIDAAIAAAREARERAYAPYSGFRVGAAVVGASGRMYAGCNIENASYGLTVCAERVAIWKAVSEGETNIRLVATVAGEGEIARSCGACLQVISEFSAADSPTLICACSVDGDYDVREIGEYLPMGFEFRA